MFRLDRLRRRLAHAVALADDVSELTKRSTRISHLEAQILAAKRAPNEVASLITRIETNARARLADLRTALADRRDLREAFLALFPEGLTFTPGIWRITGAASFGSFVGGTPPDCIATPTGFEPRFA